jgi:hypothetical protein
MPFKKGHTLHKGRIVTPGMRKKISEKLKGRSNGPLSDATKKKLSEINKGDKHPYWKGGNNRQWRRKNAPPKPDCCDVCGVLERDLKRKLFVEHCHATGRIRGWVCHRCNMAIAWVEWPLNNQELHIKIINFLYGKERQ